MSDKPVPSELNPLLMRRVAPWLEALRWATPGNDPVAAKRLKGAMLQVFAVLPEWITMTAPIERAMIEARGATVALAGAVDRGDTNARIAQEAARETLDRLINALLSAEPSEDKAARGLGW